jgi:hypothetical protein
MSPFISVQYNNAILTLEMTASVSFGTCLGERCVSGNCRGKKKRKNDFSGHYVYKPICVTECLET